MSSERETEREIISFGIGECGINLGYQTWRQYGVEHNITNDGYKLNNYKKIGPTKQIKENCDLIYSFYKETNKSTFIPRNIFIDSEPNIIDNIKISPYKNIFNNNKYLINGSQNASNNFARGLYCIGPEMMENIIIQSIRKQIEDCDNLQGFIFTNSISGGTGSGLTTSILHYLSSEYPKKIKLGYNIIPSPLLSDNIVDPYNSLLSINELIKFNEISFMLDNEKLYEICQNNLEIDRPNYNNINKLCTKLLSSVRCLMRHDGYGYSSCDLNEIQTHMIPFPRLHFLISSIAPIWNERIMVSKRCDVQTITSSTYTPTNFLVKIDDFDRLQDKYLAISEYYRGDVRPKEANATIQWLSTNQRMKFVDWCPTGFKVFLSAESMPLLPDDDIAFCKRNISALSNNTAISRVFNKRIIRKFDKLYHHKAFIHWYLKEGMEYRDFDQARENLQLVEQDYLNVLNEEWTETESDDED